MRKRKKLNLSYKVSVSALVKPKQDEALFSSVAIPQVTVEQVQKLSKPYIAKDKRTAIETQGKEGKDIKLINRWQSGSILKYVVLLIGVST